MHSHRWVKLPPVSLDGIMQIRCVSVGLFLLLSLLGENINGWPINSGDGENCCSWPSPRNCRYISRNQDCLVLAFVESTAIYKAVIHVLARSGYFPSTRYIRWAFLDLPAGGALDQRPATSHGDRITFINVVFYFIAL